MSKHGGDELDDVADLRQILHGTNLAHQQGSLNNVLVGSLLTLNKLGGQLLDSGQGLTALDDDDGAHLGGSTSHKASLLQERINDRHVNNLVLYGRSEEVLELLHDGVALNLRALAELDRLLDDASVDGATAQGQQNGRAADSELGALNIVVTDEHADVLLEVGSGRGKLTLVAREEVPDSLESGQLDRALGLMHQVNELILELAKALDVDSALGV